MFVEMLTRLYRLILQMEFIQLQVAMSMGLVGTSVMIVINDWGRWANDADGVADGVVIDPVALPKNCWGIKQ